MVVRAAAVVAAVAAASAGVGAARLWGELGRVHDRYAGWSDARVARAPILHEHVSPVPLDAFRARVGRGTRYYVDVPTGSPRLLTTTGGVFRTLATYWLLPATPVDEPQRADVILAYGADPRRLGVRIRRVEHPARGVTVAWVR